MALQSYAVNNSATVIDIEQKRADYMGNPQLDDGHTRIANELLEAIISFPFTGRQTKIVMAIIRKTYGYQKKSDKLAQSVISTMTGIAKPHVSTTLKELAAMGVVTINSESFAHIITLNKRYKEWKSSYQIGNGYQIGNYQNSNELVTETVTKPLPIREPQKKERKKESKRSIPADFSISEKVREWADANGYTNLERHLEHFRDSCLARGYTYIDWDAAFRNAIKGNWAKVQTTTTSDPLAELFARAI